MGKSYPRKIFKIGEMQNCLLDNADENARFLSERVEKLKSHRYGTSEFYQTLEWVFEEFLDVYECDKATAIMPDPSGTFATPEEKRSWIDNHLLAIEFEWHLGSILYNYHEWLVGNRQLPDIVLGRFVTDYPSVYELVLRDYISVLKRMPPIYPFEIRFDPCDDVADKEHERLIAELQRKQLYGNSKPYFASFALPSLIERYLIDFTQQGLVNKLMNAAYEKYLRGEAALSDSDLSFIRIIISGERRFTETQENVAKRCWELLERLDLIPNKDAGEIILGCRGKNPLTLGQFLNNSYAAQRIRKPYQGVLDALFSKKKVNLRNSVMHGANITFDPYAMCFSAVELQLFWLIIERKLFQ